MANTKSIGVAFEDQDLKSSNTIYALAGTGQLGYNTGSTSVAPSKVTQLNASVGQIVTTNAALAAGAEIAFVVTNSAISAYDVPIIALASGATTAGTYLLSVAAVGAGTFTIVISNASTGSLSEALTINFATIHVAQV